jgi:hypothetical protein
MGRNELLAFRSKRTVKTSKMRITSLKTESRVIPIYSGGGSIGSHKLQTGQLNLSGVSANGTRHSRIPKASLGYG